MRTNILIDDDLLAKVMNAGPFKTKKDAVEAGLKLLERQAAYREILKWEGRLKWEGDESVDWTRPPLGTPASAHAVAEPTPRPAQKPKPKPKSKPEQRRHAGR